MRFEKHARELLIKGDDAPLIAYERLGRDAMLSIPTPDHYLPLLYVIALRRKGEQVSFPVEGVDGGSVSMLVFQIGWPRRATVKFLSSEEKFVEAFNLLITDW